MIASAMAAEWLRLEAQGLRAEAARVFAWREWDPAGPLVRQADRLERAHLEPGEVLEDGRGALTPEERAAMDAVPVGGLPR
jgi:hypothetical protein